MAKSFLGYERPCYARILQTRFAARKTTSKAGVSRIESEVAVVTAKSRPWSTLASIKDRNSTLAVRVPSVTPKWLCLAGVWTNSGHGHRLWQTSLLLERHLFDGLRCRFFADSNHSKPKPCSNAPPTPLKETSAPRKPSHGLMSSIFEQTHTGPALFWRSDAK